MAIKYTGIWPSKLPSEYIRYGVDWSKRLKLDQINSVNFALEAGDTSGVGLAAPEKDGKVSKVWIANGTAGQVASIIATVVTVGGATLSERMKLIIL